MSKKVDFFDTFLGHVDAENICGCTSMARLPAFQAGDEGSSPSTRSTKSSLRGNGCLARRELSNLNRGLTECERTRFESWKRVRDREVSLGSCSSIGRAADVNQQDESSSLSSTEHKFLGASSNGRTRVSEALYGGSNPPAPAIHWEIV